MTTGDAGILVRESRDARPPAAAHKEWVPWVRPIFEVDDALLEDVRAALSAGQVTNNGAHLRDFERQLANYFGVEDCVAVSSGSAALLLSVTALGLAGAKAVLPSFTFLATLSALVHAGVTPIFCDIEPDTWTLSPTHLRRLLAADPTIGLVVPVNVFGVPPDLTAIHEALAGSRAMLVVDNAHGMGSAREGSRDAPEPVVQTYSFHATKTLPAVEGGAVVAREPRVLAEIRRLRNHGIATDPLASSPGFNAKMSELHAIVGLRALQSLDAALARRRQYAERLRRVLREDCGATFTVQRVPEAIQSSFQNLAVLCPGERNVLPAIQAALEREGIETRRYFWPPLHQLPAYRGGFSLPITDDVGRRVLCLPLHSRMEPGVLGRIEEAVRRVAADLG